jgi:V/A-type H+-transporting ATPase subunit D
MIQHPTRTNLLLLKDKARSVTASTGILKARRKALVREFLNTTIPFLRSREDVRKTYGKALQELALSLGHEGRQAIESIALATKQVTGVEISEKNIWGLRYRDVAALESPVRRPDEREYDFFSTSPHLEECIDLFEKIVESMIGIASFESKLKRLGKEIVKTTRRIRVLEERVLRDLNFRIKMIMEHIAEREREAYFRLKRFKKKSGEGYRGQGKAIADAFLYRHERTLYNISAGEGDRGSRPNC